MIRELDYQKILKNYCVMFCGTPTPLEVPDFALHQGQDYHALSVKDALLDALTRAVIVSGKVQSPQAHYFLRFGAARRLQSLWHAYSRLIAIAPPDRIAPLDDEDARELTRVRTHKQDSLFGSDVIQALRHREQGFERVLVER